MKSIVRHRTTAAETMSTMTSTIASTMTLLSTLAFVLLINSSLMTSVQALPKGFVSETVNSETKAVTGVFAPNLRRMDHRPMMLVASKLGEVRVLENPENLIENDSYANKEDDQNSNVILNLSGEEKICTNGERGLASIAVHPDFLETRWVYLYYTRWREGCLQDTSRGPQNVLVRYTMNTTTLLLENEELLLESGILARRVQNGGAMMFGTDGYLYLATGDGGVIASAQDRRNLNGSLLRLNDDGSVPEDNPYAETGLPCGQFNGTVPKILADGSDIFCSEIYSWGFRDPVRMAIDPGKSDEKKVLFSISDVGGQQFEELSWGGTDFKEKNYGWPKLEGPCAFGTIENCPPPPPGSNFVDPFYYYVHESSEGGGWVAGSSFVPEGVWPDEYKYLFIDSTFKKIYNLIEDTDAECRESCSPPIPMFINTTFYESTQEKGENINEGRMVDMFFGPYKDTKALYIVNSNTIIRIRYIEPVAVIKVKNSQHQETEDTSVSVATSSTMLYGRPINVGDIVMFDGSESFDLDGGELTFQWDFGDENDLTTNTTTSIPTHNYKEPGEYMVTLLVSNSRNQTCFASTTVVVGMFPTAVILSPMEGNLLSEGKIFRLNGEAYDYQGDPIPDDQFTWEVRLYHPDGFDFFLEGTSGNDFALRPLDLSPRAISFMRIILFVIDDNGRMSKVETDLYPNITTLELVTKPEGLKISVNNSELVAPTQIQSWANLDLPVQIISLQPPYKFQQWSDGSTNASRTISIRSLQANTARTSRVNDTTVTLEAIFCLINNASCSGATASCCNGNCNGNGFCGDATMETMMLEAKFPTNSSSLETNDDVRLIPTTKENELVRKPINSNVTNFNDEIEEKSLASSNAKVDKGSNEDEQNNAGGLGRLANLLIGIAMTLILITPTFFFASKYFQLKRKILETELKQSPQKEFKERSSPPTRIVTTSMEKKHASSEIVESDGTNISSSSSSDSFNGSISTYSLGSYRYSASLNRSAAIWEKIAEESDRRAKLRAKYSSGRALTPTTPGTPETMDTKDSPSNLDSASSSSSEITANIDETLVRLDDLLSKTGKVAEEKERRANLRAKYSSGGAATTISLRTPRSMDIRESSSNVDSSSIPNSDLTSNCHETLVRLDDLLSKTFSRKIARSSRRKQEQGHNNASLKKGTGSVLSHIDVEESSEPSALTQIWLSPNQEHTAGSSLRDKSDASVGDTTFSVASSYTGGSIIDESNESKILNLPEISDNSLLVFQDNDLSMFSREDGAHKNDVHGDPMESEMAEATFSMASLYRSMSLRDDKNNLHALTLPEVSGDSFLVFQDNDLSISNRDISVQLSDVGDNL